MSRGDLPIVTWRAVPGKACHKKTVGTGIGERFAPPSGEGGFSLINTDRPLGDRTLPMQAQWRAGRVASPRRRFCVCVTGRKVQADQCWQSASEIRSYLA